MTLDSPQIGGAGCAPSDPSFPQSTILLSDPLSSKEEETKLPHWGLLVPGAGGLPCACATRGVGVGLLQTPTEHSRPRRASTFPLPARGPGPRVSPRPRPALVPPILVPPALRAGAPAAPNMPTFLTLHLSLSYVATHSTIIHDRICIIIDGIYMITYAIRKYLRNTFLLYISALGRVVCASQDTSLLAVLSSSDPRSAAEHGQQLRNEYASSGLLPALTGAAETVTAGGTVPREGREAPGCAMLGLCLERG